MSFAKGNKSAEVSSSERYIGFGVVKVVSINPNKKELSELLGRDINEEPVYSSKFQYKDKDNKEKEGTRSRIDIWVKAEKNTCSTVDALLKMTFFIDSRYTSNKDETKFKIIDKYGNTAWITKEEYKEKKIPVYSSGKQATIDKEYKLCHRGEDNLVLFIRKFLNIKDLFVYKDFEFVKRTDIKEEDCLGYISEEDFKKLLKGESGIVKKAINSMKDNKIKVLFGVRNTDNGSFQDFYKETFWSPSYNNYSKIMDMVKKNTENDSTRIDYLPCELKTYTIASSNLDNKDDINVFDDNNNESDPFGNDEKKDDDISDSDLPF